MRGIKFRLRDRHNKIVGYEKWYCGHWEEKGWYVASPCWLYSTDGEKWNPTYIDHRFKDQFIEIKDEDGTEIYEGDKLLVVLEEFEKSKHEVVWGGEEYPAWTLSPSLECDSNDFSHILCAGGYTMKVVENSDLTP